MTKTSLKILTVIFGIIVIMLLGISFYLSPPQFIREFDLPLYAKELPVNPLQASTEFDRRVQNQFQLPMAETKLIEQLMFQKYEIDRNSKLALINKNGFPCLYSWQVSWQTDSSDNVTSTWGHFERTCL